MAPQVLLNNPSDKRTPFIVVTKLNSGGIYLMPMQGQGQGQAASLGAMEAMQVHAVLGQTISSINTMQLYQPHITDPQLGDVATRHLQFAYREYESAVQALQTRGIQQPERYPSAPQGFSPKYGLRNPPPASPGTSPQSIKDSDVASAIMGIHKCSASSRMQAALESADPELRSIFQKGANNCADQAYEVFQLMNQKGWYQVPTMQPNTTQTVVQHYQPVQGQGMGMEQQAQNQRMSMNQAAPSQMVNVGQSGSQQVRQPSGMSQLRQPTQPMRVRSGGES